MPIEHPMKIAVEAKVELLGEFIVLRSVGEPADVPDSISIIGGAPEGEPQPIHYFDSPGVERLFVMDPHGSPRATRGAPAGPPPAARSSRLRRPAANPIQVRVLIPGQSMSRLRTGGAPSDGILTT